MECVIVRKFRFEKIKLAKGNNDVIERDDNSGPVFQILIDDEIFADLF